MESNGKSVNRNGNKVDYETGSIIWGTSYDNGQHAFFQSLHQGTKMIPADFIVSLQPHDPQQSEEHDIMIANVLAQTETLMRGRNLNETYAGILATKQKIPDSKNSINKPATEAAVSHYANHDQDAHACAKPETSETAQATSL